MKLGAHVSIAGGLSLAMERGAALGAECLQIFVSSPRMWRPPRLDPEDIQRFRRTMDATPIEPIFIHTIYLLTFSASDETLRARSIESLTLALQRAEELRFAGVVTHLGGAAGRSAEEVEAAIAWALSMALDHAPGKVPLLLETSAGGTVGSTFAQLGRIIARLDGDQRLGICLDTAHVFAAGYDLRSAAGLDATLAEFEREIGLRRLTMVHVNDSKTSLGSGVDRHENIGRGKIGEAAFERLFHHPALQHLPYILEVPGFEGKGPDRENLDLLRRLAGKESRSATS